MAHVATHSTHFGTEGQGLIARLATAIANYRLYRRTLAELGQLSNRELRDLGLSRFVIREVAYDAIYGR